MPQASTSGEEQGEAANNITNLSERQLQILALVAEGRTDNEVFLSSEKVPI